MASCATLKSTSKGFFALPAHLRLQAYQQTRSFSASAPNRLNLVDIAVAGPNAILDGIHALGLPWGVAIPVSAVFVRTVLVHYISTRPARQRAELRNHLIPLASARLAQEWNYGDERRMKRKRRVDAPASALANGLSRAQEPFKRMWLGMKIMRRLSKIFGGGGLRPWGLINFGMLIAFTEAIRLKCGAREGLLPTLLSPFTWVGRQIAPSHFPVPPPSAAVVAQDPAQILAEKLWAAREAMNQSEHGEATVSSAGEDVAVSEESLLDQMPADTLTNIHSTALNPYFDPSMHVEGLPWILDLTVPDPTMILPSTLLLGLLANSILRPRPGDTTPAGSYSVLRGLTRGQRIGVVIACLFGLASVKMPAAVLLYFGPSIVAGWLHSRWLDYKYPMVPAIRPCKRPLRIGVRQVR